MADHALSEFRIYCVCGQKMKVSQAMFGRPGKCVACRQKIRIPIPEDLPPGATEIHLRDHPEFLRKPKRPSAPGKDHAADAGRDEKDAIPLGELPEVGPVSLDILEPLRILCSLENKIERQLDALASDDSLHAEASRKALMGYMDRVRNARADLDDQLRQRMMKVAIELSNLDEQVVQAGLSMRIGEVELAGFRKSVDTLWRRRDHLAREHQNLRGWLLVNDPHVAGGYVNVSLADIPEEGFELLLPEESEDPRPLLDQHIDGLREALERRERAERRLREVEFLGQDQNTPPEVLEECRADCEAEKRRAETEVTFYRKRLEQLGNDAARDVQTVQARRELANDQLRRGLLDKAHFEELERDLLQAQRDCAKIHDWVSRTLVALSPQDLPYPKGTWLKRLSRPAKHKEEAPFGMDSAVAWAAALLLGFCAFLPLVGPMSPVEAFRSAAATGQAARWVLLGPVLVGVLAAVFGALPRRDVRGLLLLGLWALFTVVAGALIHEAQYGPGLLAGRFRQGGFWLLRPGAVMIVLGDFGLLATAFVALAPDKKFRTIILAAVCGTALILLLAVTDLMGYLQPRPHVATHYVERAGIEGSPYEASVFLSNRGHRTLWLSLPENRARNAFTYALELRGGRDAWQKAPAPAAVEVTGAGEGIAMADVRNLPLRPGETAQLRYTLSPGEYRASIRANTTGMPDVVESFSLAGATDLAGPANGSETDLAGWATASGFPAGSRENLAGLGGPADTEVSVQLRGVFTPEKGDPKFSITLREPGRDPRALNLMLGDTVYDEWAVTEFNPERQTVTLGKGDRILILNRGERIPLE